MAQTPFGHKVTSSTPYTVPAGKYAVFAANVLEAGGITGGVEVKINGTVLGVMFPAGGGSYTQTVQIKPLTAKAGDIVSVGEAGDSFGIVGFLFDA